MLSGLCPTYQKPDVLQMVKGFDIHPEILHDFGIVQVVGKMIRERIITSKCCWWQIYRHWACHLQSSPTKKIKDTLITEAKEG